MNTRLKQLLVWSLPALVAVACLVVADHALAQTLDTGIDVVGEATGLGSGDPRLIVARIIRTLLGFLGVLAVVIMIYAGVIWMTAGGRDDAVKKAQRMLINAGIGLVIILSSVAITTFAINQLAGATGLSSGSTPSGGGGSGPGPSFGGSGFDFLGGSPVGVIPIRNAVVVLTFSSAVDTASVDANVLVREAGSGTPVPGTLSTVGSTVRFVPAAACPAPNASESCFDADTSYEVVIGGGLRGQNDNFVNCAFSGCSFDFTAGNLIDVTDPTVTISYPADGDSLSLNATIPVQITVTDDAGVAFVEGFADGALIGTDTPLTTSTSFVGTVDWETVGLVANSTHTLGAFGSDIAGRRVSAEDIEVVVRPASCFNGLLDSELGETGIDCGGDPSAEGYCGACSGDACTVNADCASGFCVEGRCVELPQIISVTPNDGAVGNYITVSGDTFGGATGSVVFLGDPEDDSDDVTAGLACGDAWGSSQVIVAVPDGAVSGPLLLRAANGQTDATNDAIGAALPDFTVNSTVRPGLCLVSPDDGESGDEVTLEGAGFGTADPASIVYFDTTPAGAVTRWNRDEIDAIVPPIGVGDVDVTVSVDGALSNPVNFTVEAADAIAAPVISYIDAESAPIGQMITIFGSGFGSAEGTVRFVDPFSGYEAVGDTSFPEACSEGSWTTTSITVKVPETYTNEEAVELRDHNVRIVKANGAESEAVGFEVVPGTPGPGLCASVPTLGPIGTAVTLYGENLGAIPDVLTIGGASAAVTAWSTTEITSSVPAGAVTGPIVASVGGVDSNALNFEVGSCDPDLANSCGAGYQCCPNTLACIPASMACDTTPPATNYLFTFSTGEIPIPPQVLQVCEDPAVTPTPTISPTPWGGRSGGDDVCVNALVGAAFTVPVNNLSGAVTIEECTGSGDNPCSSVVDVTSPSQFTYNADNFLYAHPSNFAPDTTYRVTVSTDVTAVGGGAPLVAPYVFTFTTRNSADECEVEEVIVTPGATTLTERGDGVISDPERGDVELTATGLGEDACVLLNTFGESINWTLTNNTSLNGVAASYAPTSGAQTLVTAQNETLNGNPVSAIVTLVEQGISGLGLIDINFTQPRVLSVWPSCGTACLEAGIGAQFNTAMNPASLTSATVTLEVCADELCTVGNVAVPITTTLNVTGTELSILPTTPFTASDAGVYYRATITDDAQSSYGVPIGNLNYGDAYSWIFRLDPNGTSCTLDRVDVTPDTAILNAIGQRQAYDVTAYGAPDSCSAAGQRLNGSTLDWAWNSTEPLVASLIGGGALDFATAPAPGCSAQCTRTGSPSDIPVCGNGGACTSNADCSGAASCVNGSCIEDGEECDFGDATPGDGCSSSCLWEGSTTTCGNNSVDAFENCDDGNTLSGDGCSAICLKEGSASVGAICGNGQVAGGTTRGESCDDGDARSGDGCSSNCLWEGSTPGILAVCGDGILGPGEDCDDSNSLNGDGCSAICLFEGGVACSDAGDPNCCGNGVVETGNFEQCDGGEGCSSSCVLQGSSIDYAVPSFCGDGILGVGEAPATGTSPACDGPTIATGDGRIDPYQYAQVAATAPQTPQTIEGYHVTTIEATEQSTNEDDAATLSVACSCEASSQCPGNGVSYGCGQATQCCFARPVVPTLNPTGANECRNAAVRVTFSEPIDTATLTNDAGDPTIALRVNLGVGESCPDSFLLARRPLDVAFLPAGLDRAVERVFSVVRPSVFALEAGGCYVPTTPIVTQLTSGTEVLLRYDDLLDENRTYTIEVYGDSNLQDAVEQGVLTVNGVALNGTASPATGLAVSGSFTTGTDVCQLDRVSVIDSSDTPGLFLSPNSDHDVTAATYSVRSGALSEIQEVPGVYEWDTTWSVGDPSIVSYSDGDPATQETGVLSSGQQVGQTSVTASTLVTVDTLFATAGEVTDGSLNVRVFLCEVPWPDLPGTATFDAPLLDSEGNGILTASSPSEWSHFSTMYCRAELLEESGAVPSTALPNFLITQVASPAAGIDREMLFRHPELSEAVGIRIIENDGLDANGDGDYNDPGDTAGYLPIEQWYAQQGINGSPTPVVIDGYDGLQDGRTIYVGGLSQTETGALIPAVFAISYSEGAGAETIDVYNQIVQNFALLQGEEPTYAITDTRLCRDAGGALALQDGENVACTTDATCIAETGDASSYCDADLTQIKRNWSRIEDLRRIENVIAVYGQTNRHCSVTTDLVCVNDSQCPGSETCNATVPVLDAGTFLRGRSTSAWPSWASELGNAVGTALPQDPLNSYVGCPDGYDDATCWNGTANLYQCPAGSHVYTYQQQGIEDYLLSADLEDVGSLWSQALLPLATNINTAIPKLTVGNYKTPTNTTGTALTCTGATYGVSASCGDGVVGASEVCELGQTGTASCTTAGGSAGLQTTLCAPDCQSFIAEPTAVCAAAGCGNGVTEGVCVGSGSALIDGTLCVSSASCGTGTCDFDASGAEICDDGALNGTYGFCSTSCDYGVTSLICGNGVVEGPEVCDLAGSNGAYNAVAANSCAWNCAGFGPYCGDGIRQLGQEQCDTEFETTLQALCTISQEPCSTNADCDAGTPGDICGGTATTNACEPQGFCVGGAFADAACDTATNELTGSPGSFCTAGDADGNPGICTTFETFRSRSCANSCSWNTWSSCERQGSCGNGVVDLGEQCDDGNSNNNDSCTNICQANVCGDGFIYPQVESCDLGASNGTACVPGYGSTCNYCTASCNYQTVSGAYCGDGQVQTAGGEICDGSAPEFGVNVTGPGTFDLGALCAPGETVDSNGYPCQVVGACNGGTNNGEACPVALSSFITNGCLDTNDGGTCVPQVCDNTCASACPFNYQSVFVLAQEWFNGAPVPGATFDDTVELFSYQTNGTCYDTNNDVYTGTVCQSDGNCGAGEVCEFLNAPDEALLSFPSCTVGDQVLADVSYDVTWPDLDVVFVLDYSASMNEVLGSNNETRWELLEVALEEAVDTLYEEYPGVVRAGTVTFGGWKLDGPNIIDGGTLNDSLAYDPDWAGQSSSADTRNSCPGEAYWDEVNREYNWPANWFEIDANATGQTHTQTAACIDYLPTTSEQDFVDFAIPPAPSNGQLAGNGTPQAAGLLRAREILAQYPADHSKVVILMSDGAPTCRDHLGANKYDGECEVIADSIFDASTLLRGDGVDVYSALFIEGAGDEDLHKERSFQLYSSDCPLLPGHYQSLNGQPSFVQTPGAFYGVDGTSPYTGASGVYDYAQYAACTDTPTYAFVGASAGAFDEMFQNIVTNIVNARITIGEGANEVTSVISAGPAIPIPLPTNFACDPNGSTTTPIQLQFGGLGTIQLSNFQFLHCPSN